MLEFRNVHGPVSGLLTAIVVYQVFSFTTDELCYSLHHKSV